MSGQQRAADLLAHYFRTAFEAAGIRWDGDHASEIEEAVEAIADMVRAEVREQLRLAEPEGGEPRC